MSMETSAPLVSVTDLNVKFVSRESTVNAVNDVNLTVNHGEVLCIIGESGSGKSVSMRALMRLLPERRTKITGKLEVDGQDVLALRGRNSLPSAVARPR
jgi:peptide/nickel transport system ATP-binding protein